MFHLTLTPNARLGRSAAIMAYQRTATYKRAARREALFRILVWGLFTTAILAGVILGGR